MTTLYIALCAYFAFNLYVTGRQAENVYESSWWRVIAFHVLSILFAGIVYAVAGIYDGVGYLLTILQVKTFWGLYVTGKYRNCSTKGLDYLNKYQDRSKTFRGCMFRWALRQVNKANNYTPAH